MATPARSVPGDSRGAVRWEQVRIPSPAGPLPARVFRPETAPHGWLVWAHGGSWRAGSASDWHHATAELTRFSRFAVVSVDYRLAPDVRHPAMVEDVLSALAWAREQARSEGTGPVPAVGGDSAGATLAACAALACRDRGEPLAAQVLAYPPLDPGCAGDSYHRYPDMFPTAAFLTSAWRAYQAPGRPVAADGTRLYSTPLEAADLSGLAPAVLATGDLDPVSDDVHHYARLLRAAGVEVALREFHQTGHAAFLQPGAGPAGPGAQDPLSMRSWLGLALHELTHPDSPAAPDPAPSLSLSRLELP